MLCQCVVLLLALVFFVSGCGGSGRQLLPSKDLVIATAIPIGGVEPFSSRMGIGANLIDLLYRRAYKFGADGRVIPDIARDVEWQDNGKQLVLRLPQGRAKDLAFTVNQVKARSGGDFFEAFKGLDKIEVVNDNEIRFYLKRFDRAFFAMLGQLPILRESSPELGDDFVVERQGPEEIILRRNLTSSTQVNRIIIKVIASSRRAIRELVAGNVDLLFLVNEGDYKVLSELPEINVQKLHTRMVYGVMDNRDHGRLSPFFWSQISSAIHRDEFVKHLGEIQVEPAYHSVPADSSWWHQSFDEPIDMPLQMAGVVPAAMGPRKLTFLGNLYYERRAARILKRQFESVGVPLELENLPPQDFELKVLKKRDFDLIMMPLNMKDPLMIHYLVFHTTESDHSLNLTHYGNSSVDAYLEKARYAQDDGESRHAFAQAIQFLKQDPPGLFLFWLKTPIVHRKACSGFSLNSSEFFSSLKDVRCEPSAAN